MDNDSAEESSAVSNSEIPTWSGRLSKNGHDVTLSSSQHSYRLNHKNCEEQGTSKTECRATPHRAQYNYRAAGKQKTSDTRTNAKPCEHHTFLTDITEVRQMEQSLLKLLDDFHLGKLQAFGRDCTFEKMEQVREQQERLARVHFELNAQQEMYGPQSGDGRRVGRENLKKLIENLQHLSHSIEQLQIANSTLQTDV